MHIAYYSTNELYTGILCICLPTIRLILVRISPRIFSSQGPNANAAEGSSRGVREAADPFANLQPYMSGDEERGLHGRLNMSNVRALDNVP
jgi:hypothetical protein